MTTSFENLNKRELLKKRERLYFYIDKINKELEKRESKMTISDRIDTELIDLENSNANVIKKIINKISKQEKSKKPVVHQTRSTNGPNPVVKITTTSTSKPKVKVKVSTKKKKTITVAIIKKGLDTKGIKYKSSARKDDLMALVRKNNLVRYIESLTA